MKLITRKGRVQDSQRLGVILEAHKDHTVMPLPRMGSVWNFQCNCGDRLEVTDRQCIVAGLELLD